jgi:membrane protease YdiL (CAAX protease family)
VPYALFGSSLAFGMAHLSVKDLPELTSLGLLLGLSYLRTRNLLTPMLIHGLWNGTVLIALYSAALDPSTLINPTLLPTWLSDAAQPGRAGLM